MLFLNSEASVFQDWEQDGFLELSHSVLLVVSLLLHGNEKHGHGKVKNREFFSNIYISLFSIKAEVHLLVIGVRCACLLIWESRLKDYPLSNLSCSLALNGSTREWKKKMTHQNWYLDVMFLFRSRIYLTCSHSVGLASHMARPLSTGQVKYTSLRGRG